MGEGLGSKRPSPASPIHDDDDLRRRRRTSPSPSPASPISSMGEGLGSKRPSPASPLHDDDLLAEILVRLRLPSSLPRASLVCTGWRRLVTDPYFRARNWRPLGVFLHGHGHGTEQGRVNLSFAVISESDAPKLLSVRHEEIGGGNGSDAWELSRGRPPHGHFGVRRVLVWNPVSGEHHFVDVPPDLSDPDRSRFHVQAAVTCASGDDMGPFQVALRGSTAAACTPAFTPPRPATGVTSFPPRSGLDLGSVLAIGTSWLGICSTGCFFDTKACILEFDLGGQNLAVIDVPRDAYADHHGLCLSTLAEGGGLSLISMTANLRAPVWEGEEDDRL